MRTPCTLPLDPPLPWESKAVFDSGSQVLDSNLCQWHLDSGFQSLVGYRILELYSRFQSLGIRDSTSRNFPDSRIRILLNKGVHYGPQIRQKQQKQLTEINITLDYESELVTNNGGIYGLFQEFSLRERRKLKKSAPEKTSRCVWRKDKKFLSFFLSPSRPLLFSFALYFGLMQGNPNSGKQEIFARGSLGIWNTAKGIRISTDKWNLESQMHRQRLESTTWESGATVWNPRIQDCLGSPYIGRLLRAALLLTLHCLNAARLR